MTIEFVGLMDETNQGWFYAIGGYKPKTFMWRKRWGAYTSTSRPKAWRYETVYGATRFDDIVVAKAVCDKLNREDPKAKWRVVRYKEKTIKSMKTLYKGEHK